MRTCRSVQLLILLDLTIGFNAARVGSAAGLSVVQVDFAGLQVFCGASLRNKSAAGKYLKTIMLQARVRSAGLAMQTFPTQYSRRRQLRRKRLLAPEQNKRAWIFTLHLTPPYPRDWKDQAGDWAIRFDTLPWLTVRPSFVLKSFMFRVLTQSGSHFQNCKILQNSGDSQGNLTQISMKDLSITNGRKRACR